MAHQSDKSTSRSATSVPAGVISIYQITGLALPRTTAFGGPRVLNALSALSLFFKSASMPGAYASRVQPARAAQPLRPKAGVA